MLEIATPYFSLSSRCEIPNICVQCSPMQHARIPLQLAYCLLNLTMRARFNKSLNLVLRSSKGAYPKCVRKLPQTTDLSYAGRVLLTTDTAGIKALNV